MFSDKFLVRNIFKNLAAGDVNGGIKILENQNNFYQIRNVLMKISQLLKHRQVDS